MVKLDFNPQSLQDSSLLLIAQPQPEPVQVKVLVLRQTQPATPQKRLLSFIVAILSFSRVVFNLPHFTFTMSTKIIRLEIKPRYALM